MLTLYQLIILSDEALGFRVKHMRSYEEFVTHGVINNIPDATKITIFREQPCSAGVIKELFEMIDALSTLRGSWSQW